jgi:hypothetical protein
LAENSTVEIFHQKFVSYANQGVGTGKMAAAAVYNFKAGVDRDLHSKQGGK